jgi:hypothetical protein
MLMKFFTAELEKRNKLWKDDLVGIKSGAVKYGE